MKSPTCSSLKRPQKFSRILPEALVNKLAVQSGFVQRTPRKCTPLHFVLSFFMSCSLKLYSLSSWAQQLSTLSGTPFSKQGLAARLSGHSSAFARHLLTHLLRQRSRLTTHCRQALGAFRSVLIQDSTTIALQAGLQQAFKGNRSHGAQKALVRIKTIIDLLSMQVLHMGISSYCQNDQSAAANIHPFAHKDTLVLRDMGYWSVDSLQKLAARGALFLSRLRYGMNLYDERGRLLPYKDFLNTKGVDKGVLLCAGYRLGVRLLVIPLPEGLAQSRVRRAKNHRDYRLHHSADYYRFCRYDVFITNASQQQLPLAAAQSLYRLRWQVELFFKALKSGGMQLPQLLGVVRTQAERVRTTVLLALCFVVLTLQQLASAFTQHFCALSLLKVMKWALSNFIGLLSPAYSQLLALMPYCCRYEKRKRKALLQKIPVLTKSPSP